MEPQEDEFGLSNWRILGVSFIVLGVAQLICNGFYVITTDLIIGDVVVFIGTFYMALCLIFALITLASGFLIIYFNKGYEQILALGSVIAMLISYLLYSIQNLLYFSDFPFFQTVVISLIQGLVPLILGMIGVIICFRNRSRENNFEKFLTKRQILGGLFVLLGASYPIQIGYHLLITSIVGNSQFSVNFYFSLVIIVFSALAVAGVFMILYFNRSGGISFALIGSIGQLAVYLGWAIYRLMFGSYPPYRELILIPLFWCIIFMAIGIIGGVLAYKQE